MINEEEHLYKYIIDGDSFRVLQYRMIMYKKFMLQNGGENI